MFKVKERHKKTQKRTKMNLFCTEPRELLLQQTVDLQCIDTSCTLSLNLLVEMRLRCSQFIILNNLLLL